MGELPKKQNAIKEPRFGTQMPRRACPADQWRHCPGDRSDERTNRRFSFKRGVDQEIIKEREQRKCACKQVHADRQEDDSEHGQDDSERKAYGSPHAACSERTPRSTAHLCVEIPFDVLIQCPGAACYQKCPNERACQEGEWKMARLMRMTQIEAREGRQDDQEIDFWFGEGQQSEIVE